MRTLLISDLHLGSRMRRDVLRRPIALERLCDALGSVDRLVLLGDTVELLEGRPERAMADAEPVLRAIGSALGKGGEVILLPGNHDHALVRPWLEARRERGRSLGLGDRVAVTSSPELQAIGRWLRPAKFQVRYPGVDLGDGIWAHHGHYLDRHLIRRPQVGPKASADDYEGALGTSIAGFAAGFGAALPPALAGPLDRASKVLHLAGMAAIMARPAVAALPGASALAPLNSAGLGFQFRRVGLPAMAAVGDQLGVRAGDVIFGHLHRAGPHDADDPSTWEPGEQRLWNTGCWVYEPLLVGGASPPHPYWPGGAVQIDDGVITSLGLLDDVQERELR